jgi:hypothetical protein
MDHVPDSSLLPRRRAVPCVLLLLSTSVLIAASGCPEESEGDDLPPGAFTTGGDDVIDPSVTDDVTSVDPGDTTTSAPDTGSDDVPPGELSHATDIQPIWNANCVDGVCHDSDGPPQAGLDLQSDGVRDRLCTTNSSSQTSIALVDCDGADPEASWLWSKVTGEGLELPGAGSLMPVGGMLSSDDIATIEAWIAGGALP